MRRDFHRHPELGMQEVRTGRIVAEYLEEYGIQWRRLNGTGISGLLRGGHPGKTILLRADMDALPIQEQAEVDYQSKNKGVMHACGHDAHTAMLLVAARILAGEQQNLHGNVKFVFEPNEENMGSLAMIEEGVLEDPQVDACLALHVWSPLGAGRIGLKAGPVMAGMKHFELTLHGKGGHTAIPHSAVDPILAASAIIQGVQAVQTRELDILQEPAVIMFGSIAGGSADNVIPDSVVLKGTIRYLFQGDEFCDDSPLSRFKRIVAGICEAHRVSFDLNLPISHPTLINDPQMTEMLLSKVLPRLGTAPDVEPLVSLAGEDFAEFAARIPSVFCFLGAGFVHEVNFPHHHPCFRIDEDVLKVGVELHVRTALQFLQKERDD